MTIPSHSSRIPQKSNKTAAPVVGRGGGLAVEGRALGGWRDWRALAASASPLQHQRQQPSNDWQKNYAD